MPAKVQKKKQTYVKKDPISHILDRSDMYVGSTRSRNVDEYVVVDSSYHIEKRTVNVSPAIVRIFVEPLSNVIDNVARSRQGKNKVTKIQIDIDEKTGQTSLWNDGESIPVEIHDEEKCYNHTMIFGHLLTSSNYDDEDDRQDISGRNGLGVKTCNVFSTEFKVEGVDPVNKKLFKQTWKNNMRDPEEPTVKASKSAKGYTKVTFTPDFKRFGIEGYTEDILSLYKRYAVDTAMVAKVPVILNGDEIPVENLSDYAKLYSNEDVESLSIKTKDCEVVVTPAKEYHAVSFANGVCTPLGGTHVDAWSEAIFRPLVEKLNKPKKPQINIGDVKKFFRLFITATVKKPEFDSQSKTKLEAPQIQAEVKKSHIAAISKWPVMERLEDLIRAKEMVILKKAERKKRGHVHIEGLDPANNEGTVKSGECTLILVEGLSAKTYASCGIQKGAFGKKGRDWFGIFALRGKILNCRNSKPVTIAKNRCVTDIIKALGIQHDVDYTKDEHFKALRYGRVMIITDQDVDGLHISGLLQNMFHALFPSLLKRDPPFLTAMYTPLVRVYGRKDTIFYDEDVYQEFVRKNANKKISKKYYKGLGTSNDDEVLETFGQKLVVFKEDAHIFENMNKAFHTKYADMRKTWLEQYDPTKKVLKWEGDGPEIKSITYSDYIDTELIKFSIDDCKRSIPSLMDGLKEGHRKVLYVAFKRNYKNSGKVVKVAQLAGFVSADSNYHHGEQNLEKTITGMANSFVGSNNVPLLYRDGQFGSRMEGGADAASGRYIWTKLDTMTRYLFREEDDCLLDYIEDDGDSVEPRFYVPILPTILINGCIAGIGTGWSCSVPCYNPKDLISSVKQWLANGNTAYNDEEECLLEKVKPWYRGHTGEMTESENGSFVSWGRVEKSRNKPVVTELPVGMWTSDFVEVLGKMREEKQISSYKNHSTPKDVNFTITESTDGILCDEKSLKLFKTIRTSNMVLFASKGGLRKFATPEDIIDSFCEVRYEYYVKRKMHRLKSLEKEIKVLGNKKRFLQEVRDGIFRLFDQLKKKKVSRSTADIVAELEERGYDRVTAEDPDEGDVEEKVGGRSGYEYLLRLQISSVTAEKINKLENDIASRESERDLLQSTSEAELWIKDLDEFEEEYDKWLPVINNEVVKKKK